MGNVGTCLPSLSSGDVTDVADGVSCGVCVHEYLFPMYLVKDSLAPILFPGGCKGE